MKSQDRQARAVIYCRVSTVDQVQNQSLPTQEKECRAYCHRNDLELVRVFIEKGESAKTADRTELKEMIAFVTDRKNAISSIVVYALSRFARNATDHLMLRQTLRKHAVTLRSATEPIDESSEGKLMEGFLALSSEYDNDKRSDRTKAGMKAAVENGGYPLHPPLGYRPARKVFGGGTLAILQADPDRAPLIRRAFEMVAEGMTKADALRAATAQGLRTKRGKALSSQTFNEMLKKPIYCGRIEKWGIKVNGSFDPILSEELFDRVQIVLRGNMGGAAGPHLRHHPEFPLRHFMTCSHCAKPLTGSSSTGRNQRYAYYHCRTRGCKARSYPVGEVENEFRLFVERLQPKPDMVAALCDAAAEAWKKKRSDAEKDKAALNRKHSDLMTRKTQLRESLIYRREISKEDYEEEKNRLGSEIVDVEMQLATFATDENDIDAVVGFAKHFLSNAGPLWSEASPEMKLRIQDVLFPSGVHFDGETFGTARTNMVFSELAPIASRLKAW